MPHQVPPIQGHPQQRSPLPAAMPRRKPVTRGRNHQRQRNERADADHLEHVEEHRRAQANAPLESAGLVLIKVAGNGLRRDHSAAALHGLYTDENMSLLEQSSSRSSGHGTCGLVVAATASVALNAQQALTSTSLPLAEPQVTALPLPEDRGEAALRRLSSAWAQPPA